MTGQTKRESQEVSTFQETAADGDVKVPLKTTVFAIKTWHFTFVHIFANY